MKLHLFKLAFASFVFATCCKAGFNFDAAEHAAENLNYAITKARTTLPGNSGPGKNIAELPWKNDERLIDEISLHFHNPRVRYANLGALDGFDLYGTNWKVKLPDEEQPQNRLFIFAVKHELEGDVHYAPLGFARYEIGGTRHGQSAFWKDSNRLIPTETFKELRHKGRFPPEKWHFVGSSETS